jgi:hypothetical protein
MPPMRSRSSPLAEARGQHQRGLVLEDASFPMTVIGSHLARVELTIAFAELLRRIPDFGLDRELRWHHGQVRGLYLGNCPSASLLDGPPRPAPR